MLFFRCTGRVSFGVFRSCAVHVHREMFDVHVSALTLQLYVDEVRHILFHLTIILVRSSCIDEPRLKR